MGRSKRAARLTPASRILVCLIGGTGLSCAEPKEAVNTTSRRPDAGATGHKESVEIQIEQPGHGVGRSLRPSGRTPAGSSTKIAARHSQVEYERLLGRIESCAEEGDLAAVTSLASEIEMQWNQGNRVHYFDLMFRICYRLHCMTSCDSEKRDELLHEYAGLIVAKEPATPLGVEVRLIPLLTAYTGHKATLAGDARAERRARTAQLVFHVWRRIATSRDLDFDFDDVFCLNIPPPPQVQGQWVAGMAPEALSDPTLRREYEKAFEENKRKAEEYGRQYGLRRMWERFSEQAESYVIKAYSRKPYASDELKRYLKESGLDEETKTRILKSVTDKAARDLR